MTTPNSSALDDYKRRVNSTASWSYPYYILLLIPIILFLISLYVRPTMGTDSGFGFLVLRSMLEGGAFNNVTVPDPANIANDSAFFQAWWSPGQYLVPGAFVWLGTNYGLALSLTALISTVIGVIGWAQVARSVAATPFVLFVFLTGLVTFRYATLPFRAYGGEVLLFAVAPWSLYWLRNAVDGPPAICFAISLLSFGLLFIAKLTGLIVFFANVLAISLLEVVRQRRLTPTLLAMFAASVTGGFLFLVFWVARGDMPATGHELAFTWRAISFPVAGAIFSGISAIDLLSSLLVNPSAPPVSFDDMAGYVSYALAPLGLILAVYVWHKLRDTPYRGTATALFTIIALYTAALAVMFVRGAYISYEERHLRYAGILFFLLLLIALDQWRSFAVKSAILIIVGALAVNGLVSYANGARILLRGDNYEPFSGTSQLTVSPIVLEHLRSEMAQHNWKNAIAVLPSSEAAIGLTTRYRVMISMIDFVPREILTQQRFDGRVDKIIVIVQERMVDNGKAETLLKSFIDYEYAKWDKEQIGGMVVYLQ